MGKHTTQYSKGKGRLAKSKPLTKDQLFTGGKRPEFTVFYNLAFLNIAGLIYHLTESAKDNKTYEDSKDKWELAFKKWKSSINSKDQLSDAGYAILRRYLWKSIDKNSSGHILTEEDKQNIRDLLITLYQIRNFHSHYWHDNAVLECSNTFKKFMAARHLDAINAMAEKHAGVLSDYRKEHGNWPHFKTHGNKAFITQEGRTFFLSFFLTKGQMSRFLQQRRGSKRNDKPEYKIKQLVYQFHAHREGAAKHFFGHQKEVFDQLPEDLQEKVWKARQGFKLVGYLNDVPGLSNDPELFPLFLKSGIQVSNVEEMSDWCQEQRFLPELTMKAVQRELKDRKGKAIETIVLERVLELHFPEFPTMRFQLSVPAFHRLILDTLRREDKGERILEKLREFASERIELREMLQNPVSFKGENGEGYREILEVYYNNKLKASDKLKRKLGKLIDLWTDTKKWGKFEEFCAEFLEKLSEAPVELAYYDFPFEKDSKPRANKNFTRYAVQYLIDFRVVPKWEWMFETFESETGSPEDESDSEVISKRSTIYSSTVPKGYRLAITEDHVLVKVPGCKRPFQLGYRVLKNLVIAHLDEDQDKSIEQFLPKLVGDLNKLSNADKNSDKPVLKFLSASELPASIMRRFGESESPAEKKTHYSQKAKSRIEYISEILKPIASGNYADLRLSRAEKNRQIMRCYLYFDWKYPNNNAFKFLRKDQYQRMSVYHYCLDKSGVEPGKGSNAFLLNDILSHMPIEVKRLLRSSDGLDSLLVNTAQEVLKILKDWEKELPEMNDQNFELVLRKLGISLGEGNGDFSTLPFNVHPILPIKVFYNKELLSSEGKFSLSHKIRESAVKGLQEAHYNYRPFLESYNMGPQSRKVKKKVIGRINEVYTQDILLWNLALKYLGDSIAAIRELAASHLEVGALRQQSIPLPLG